MVRRHVHGFLSRRLSSEEYLGLHLTVGLILCLLLVGGFSLLAHNVVGDPALTDLDTRLGVRLQEHRQETPALRAAFLGVTQLGERLTLTVLGVLVALALLVRRRRVLALVWLLALLVGGLLNNVLKDAFGRARPEFIDAHVIVTNESFPSGHALGSIVVYGLLAYLLFLSVRTRRARVAVVAVTAVLVLAIGFSRLYLGAHYLSDVVGGFAVGGAWLAACVSGIESARRRARQRKQEAQSPPAETPSA
jgi:undecaprenyl-diphosphatase